MGGQVLGGGVIVLVSAALWLVYLLPSWYSRHQCDAAERNAVRLNQALRVLAETSEAPDEVRLELTARTALAQQRLARKAQADREDLARRSQAERDDLARRTQHEREQAEVERARRELAVARSRPEARRARTRRRARLVVSSVALIALALAGWGVWDVVATGSSLVLWTAVAAGSMCAVLLARTARVGSRAVAHDYVQAAFAPTAEVQDVALAHDRRAAWSPRELPRPLTASAGSRAAAVLDGVAARQALRDAAREEAMLARIERRSPTSIEAARVARAAEASVAPSSGLRGDAEIEAHVRELLRRRAVG